MKVLQARKENADAYSALFARTFSDDPMVTWPLPGDDIEQRVKRNWLAFGPALVEAGWVWEVAPLQGFATWIPPGETASFLQIDERSRNEVAAITSDGGARYDRLWSWLEGYLPDEPHWYLDHIAVAPERQGRGVGSTLIRFGLDRAAAGGVPAFLETARERNVPLYEHLGFRTVVSEPAPDGGPTIWFMRRDPA